MNVNMCLPVLHPDSLKTQMLPLSIGNFWVYEDVNNSGKKDTIKFEINNLQNVYYIKLGNRKKMQAYHINKITSQKLPVKFESYYVKCESQTQLVYSEENDPTKIIGFLDIVYENPETSPIDSTEDILRFAGTENITTKFGNLNCYVMEKMPRSKKEFLASHNRSYYHKGIGLVKVVYFAQDKIVSERNLIKYEVKN